MSQQLEEMFPVLNDTREVLSTLKEELEDIFPNLVAKNDKILARVDGSETELVGWINTRHYYVGITYEDKKLAIEPIVDLFMDPSDDVPFVTRFLTSIKDMLEEYDAGNEMDYITAEMWINHFEKGLRAREKDDKLRVVLKPRYEDDEYPSDFIDVYEAKGEIHTTHLIIKFRPLRPRGMKFIISGELTTKRFEAILRLIRSFEMH